MRSVLLLFLYLCLINFKALIAVAFSYKLFSIGLFYESVIVVKEITFKKSASLYDLPRCTVRCLNAVEVSFLEVIYLILPVDYHSQCRGNNTTCVNELVRSEGKALREVHSDKPV